MFQAPNDDDPARESPGGIDPQLLALVTARVLQTRRIGFLHRVEPNSPRDSGWTAFAGDEDKDYANDPANYHSVSLGDLLELHESLAGVLAEPPGAAFELDAGDVFRRVR
jgi:hypothetical protein